MRKRRSDLSPINRSMRKEGFPAILTRGRTSRETQAILRRTDRLDPQRARDRRLGGRPGPHARRRRAAGPPLEVQVRRHDGTRPEAAQASNKENLRLKREGLAATRKRKRRVYARLGLQVRAKRRRRLWRPRVRMAMPTRPNERWSIDFMSDQLASGRRFRILNVVVDFSRMCVGQLVATSITGARLALFLDELGKAPKAVVCDNGPELTSKAMRFWSERSGAALNFIQPGKPTQNAFVESFNGKFRDSCLNQHWFRGLADVRRIVDDWRHHYNHERPHSSLGYSTPAERAKKAA